MRFFPLAGWGNNFLCILFAVGKSQEPLSILTEIIFAREQSVSLPLQCWHYRQLYYDLDAS